ncbi:unnamed protein product [Brassica oleracea var. botrytis]
MTCNLLFTQSQTRRFLCRRHYVRMKKAAIATQCGWRVRVARRELRNLKMAAKEAGALQDAKSKLENQLEELTSNLELEKQMRVHITSLMISCWTPQHLLQHCLFSDEKKIFFLNSL